MEMFYLIILEIFAKLSGVKLNGSGKFNFFIFTRWILWI